MKSAKQKKLSEQRLPIFPRSRPIQTPRVSAKAHCAIRETDYHLKPGFKPHFQDALSAEIHRRDSENACSQLDCWSFFGAALCFADGPRIERRQQPVGQANHALCGKLSTEAHADFPSTGWLISTSLRQAKDAKIASNSEHRDRSVKVGQESATAFDF
jgi:hypothetical protein